MVWAAVFAGEYNARVPLLRDELGRGGVGRAAHEAAEHATDAVAALRFAFAASDDTESMHAIADMLRGDL